MIGIPGVGAVELANARWNTPGQLGGVVEVAGGAVVPRLGGRTYFANSCEVGGMFDPSRYIRLSLLGKTMRWTTDLSGATCGCNAALYLTSLAQNQLPSTCGDYYCDASNVCGVSCTEVDLQEANMYAWLSTLHTDGDPQGRAVGYGHSHSQWNASVYGPYARCIDTMRPVDVAISFPRDETTGSLLAVSVELSQLGSPCPLQATLGDYGAGMAQISAALAEGMTPIISYWESSDMLWMDGGGADNSGPCVQDTPASCAESVRFYSFSVEEVSESTMERIRK